MISTNTVIESRHSALSGVLAVRVGLHGGADDVGERRDRRAAERAIDDVLADSFPASDPPSWNSGVSRPPPVASMHHRAAQSERMDAGSGGTRSGVTDVSPRAPDWTLIEALMSLAGAGGIALLVPFAILVIGMPVALAVRGLVEAIGWLFGIVVR